MGEHNKPTLAEQHQRETWPWLIATEFVGPSLTGATAVSLIGLFEGTSWVTSVLLAVTLSHLFLLLMRYLKLKLPTAALVDMVCLVLLITWTHYSNTTFWALPTSTTASQVGQDLGDAWASFGDTSAPVEPATGYVISAIAAVWMIAFFVDWAAMRSKSPYLALVLPLLAVSFVEVVGDSRDRNIGAYVLVAVLLLFLCVCKITTRTTGARWLGGAQKAKPARRALLGAGTAIGAAGLCAALLAAPALSNNEDPIINLTEAARDLTDAARSSEEAADRVVISPLVDIRGRLVNRSEDVMFQVKTQQRSYWRLTSLNLFDGQIWSSRADYASRSTQLPFLFQSGSTVQDSTQEFTIKRLSTVWLPAAFEPYRVTSETNQISYEPTSSTLIVDRSLSNSNGLSYTVQSALPRFNPTELNAVSVDMPLNTELGAYTLLPDNFSPQVRNTAAQITQQATSRYEQALALQNYFRNGNFIYDDSVATGHSNDRIETFLATRRGYCEQFAGTFAAMARSVGLAARVAVGFTVGEADTDDPNLFVVRGKHAHAWPEIYLQGAGWVAFEPTPSRGAPNAWNYTGVAESQAVSLNPPQENLATGDSPASQVPSDEIDLQSLIAQQVLETSGSQTQNAAQNSTISSWVWVTLAVAAGLVLFAVLVPAVAKLRRWRRHRRLSSNRDHIQMLWADTIGALRFCRITPEVSETHEEFAHRAIQQVPLHNKELHQLSKLAAAATFAPSDPSEDQKVLAHTWALAVRSEVNLRLRRSQRLLATYLPWSFRRR
ncbi:MAG: transglutaminaseTgpA domain-containing protein [bacterium]|nr:transglutaminaseTgpA domain-containing protein [bacterium]